MLSYDTHTSPIWSTTMIAATPILDYKELLIPKPPVTTLYIGGSGLDIVQVTDMHLAGHYLSKKPHLAALRRLFRYLQPQRHQVPLRPKNPCPFLRRGGGEKASVKRSTNYCMERYINSAAFRGREHPDFNSPRRPNYDG